MIIITGGAGFIGSNYIKYLNSLGKDDLIVVDNFKNGRKFKNISNLSIEDVVQKETLFESHWLNSSAKKITKIIHLGACSSTQEWNGAYLLENNYEYSKKLFQFSLDNKVDFLYASSASVYGLGEKGFKEDLKYLKPINAYAYTKYLFDQYVNKRIYLKPNNLRIIGLRFFNVYGPGEYFKEDMSSPIYKFYNQLKKNNICNVFGSYDGYEDGKHLRDFIHVNDCCKIINFLSDIESDINIFNVGTGEPTTFIEVANLIIKYLQLNKNLIKFIPFPETLKGNYQSYTCADLGNLQKVNYSEKFISISDGIKQYIDILEKNYISK